MASPSPQVAQALATVSEKYNIPLWHLYAVANRESSFDPNAVNGWDGWAGSGYPGTGLFQLSGAHWSTPNINPGSNGDWVANIFKPGDFSTLTNARDPLQNATRYAEYASRWYNYLHQKYPSWNDNQLWSGVAYNWNKGLYADPAGSLTNQDYLRQYNNYAESYKQDVATFGHINTGGPTVVGGTSPLSNYGPSAGAGMTSASFLGQQRPYSWLFPNTSTSNTQPQNIQPSSSFLDYGPGRTGLRAMNSLNSPFSFLRSLSGNASALDSPFSGIRSYTNELNSPFLSLRRGNPISPWLDYYKKISFQ